MKNNDSINIELKLLKEAIWNIEDKLNVLMESIANHETEIIQLKRLSNLCLKRIALAEKQKRIKRRRKLA